MKKERSRLCVGFSYCLECKFVMSIKEEIDQMFNDICGNPIEEEKSYQKKKEKLDENKRDVLRFFKECYGLGLPAYQKDFIRQLEDEVNHRSGWGKHYFECRCGTIYEITNEKVEFGKYGGMWVNEMLGEPYRTLSDRFYCFKCGQPINTVGEIIKISSVDSKYYGFNKE